MTLANASSGPLERLFVQSEPGRVAAAAERVNLSALALHDVDAAGKDFPVTSQPAAGATRAEVDRVTLQLGPAIRETALAPVNASVANNVITIEMPSGRRLRTLTLTGLKNEAGAIGDAVDFAARLDADIGPLRGVFEIVDGGLPTDPEALAKLVIEFVLPFPAATIGQLRGVVDRIALDLDGLAMPGQRLAGLTIELDAITAAAEAGHLAEVDARLQAAASAAAIGVASLRADLARRRGQIGALDIAGQFDPLAPALGAFRTGRHELPGLLAELQEYLRAGRLAMEELTPEAFNDALDQAEGFVSIFVDGSRARLEALVDAEIAEWLRGLFAHLGLRALRAEISDGLQAIVDKIRELDPAPLLDAIGSR